MFEFTERRYLRSFHWSSPCRMARYRTARWAVYSDRTKWTLANSLHFETSTHSSGKVDRNIFKRQAQVCSQTFNGNCSPQEITKFSKQLMADLANCSLSRSTRVYRWWSSIGLLYLDEHTRWCEYTVHRPMSREWFERIEWTHRRWHREHGYMWCSSIRFSIRRKISEDDAREARLTSTCPSASFIVSKMRKIILNNSVHQAWVNVSP